MAAFDIFRGFAHGLKRIGATKAELAAVAAAIARAIVSMATCSTDANEGDDAQHSVLMKVPVELAPNMVAQLAGIERHYTNNRLSGHVHHFAAHAARATLPTMGHYYVRESLQIKRRGDRLRHFQYGPKRRWVEVSASRGDAQMESLGNCERHGNSGSLTSGFDMWESLTDMANKHEIHSASAVIFGSTLEPDLPDSGVALADCIALRRARCEDGVRLTRAAILQAEHTVDGSSRPVRRTQRNKTRCLRTQRIDDSPERPGGEDDAVWQSDARSDDALDVDILCDVCWCIRPRGHRGRHLSDMQVRILGLQPD